MAQCSATAEKWAREAAQQGIHGQMLDAESEVEEVSALDRPLVGGRPSRYDYIPILDTAAVAANQVMCNPQATPAPMTIYRLNLGSVAERQRRAGVRRRESDRRRNRALSKEAKCCLLFAV